MTSIISFLESMSKFLLAQFPGLLFAFSVGAFMWFAHVTNTRLDRIESVEIPKLHEDIHNLEVRVIRVEDKVDQLSEELRELKNEVRTNMTELRGDIKLILSKMK